jgi:hypothetical protein
MSVEHHQVQLPSSIRGNPEHLFERQQTGLLYLAARTALSPERSPSLSKRSATRKAHPYSATRPARREARCLLYATRRLPMRRLRRPRGDTTASDASSLNLKRIGRIRSNGSTNRSISTGYDAYLLELKHPIETLSHLFLATHHIQRIRFISSGADATFTDTLHVLLI